MMYAMKCLGVFLLGLLSLTHAQDSCLQDLAQNEDFQKCSQEFSNVMREMEAYVPGPGDDDMSATYKAMCTPEGKAGMACIMGFIFDCPQLQASMQMEGGIDFSEMMKEGGIEVMCELFTSETCRPRMDACLEKMNGTMPDMDPAGMVMSGPGNAPTPYSMVPAQMLTMCGPMYDMLSCILGVTDECPKTAQYMEDMLEKMSEMLEQQGGPAMPSYAESKKYIMESCPTLPQDFKAKQGCIGASLAKPEFQECYKNVTDNKQNNCDVYVGGKACVMEHVGMDCGGAYADAIATAAPLFSFDIPSGCDGPVGGVSNLEASVMTMIGAAALLLLFFQEG